jgi:hypothetical protein
MPKPDLFALQAVLALLIEQHAKESDVLKKSILYSDIARIKKELQAEAIRNAGIPVGTAMFYHDDHREPMYRFVSMDDKGNVMGLYDHDPFGTEALIVGRRSDYVYQIKGQIYDLYYWERD